MFIIIIIIFLLLILVFVFSSFFIAFFLRAAPEAYGGSQARGQIRATAGSVPFKYMFFSLPSLAPVPQRGTVLDQEGLACVYGEGQAWSVAAWLLSEIWTASDVQPVQSPVTVAPSCSDAA